MIHEGKLGKYQHLIVRKSVGVLVLVGKSNKGDKYNILLYERVIEGVGGNFFLLSEPVGYELVGVGNRMLILVNIS